MTDDEFRMEGYGTFIFDFNPLTGDLTITSRTGLLVVEPIEPGKMRLSTKRREGTPGVAV